MRIFFCFIYLIFGAILVEGADPLSSGDIKSSQVSGVVSAIDTDAGTIELSGNDTPKIKVFLRKYSSILLWTLSIGQSLRVSGVVNESGTPPEMTITSLDDICETNADGTSVAWPNPIMVEGDPDKGITPMIAFTAPIRESDAKQAHDGLMQRYQTKLAAQSARITASLGGHTGLPLDLDYLMPKDAVLQHLKLIDVFRVDSENPCELAYVVPNPDSNTKNALFVTFDDDKLVRIADVKSGMNKAMFDSYMLQLKGIASKWKASGCTPVFENEKDMYYVYKDMRSYMSISGAALRTQPDLYSVTVEYTEKTYQNKILK